MYVPRDDDAIWPLVGGGWDHTVVLWPANDNEDPTHVSDIEPHPSFHGASRAKGGRGDKAAIPSGTHTEVELHGHSGDVLAVTACGGKSDDESRPTRPINIVSGSANGEVILWHPEGVAASSALSGVSQIKHVHYVERKNLAAAHPIERRMGMQVAVTCLA